MSTSNSKVNGSTHSHYMDFRNLDDWFSQDITSPGPFSKDSFDADITALDDPNDSGYFSSENVESCENVSTKGDKPSNSRSTDSPPSDLYSGDVAASTEAENGSAYDGLENKSTATQERRIPCGGQTLKSSKKARLYDFDSLSLPEDADFVHGFPGLTLLQTWVQNYERHELIAYRLEQPPKRRRTVTGRR